jgi:hypothetical protein
VTHADGEGAVPTHGVAGDDGLVHAIGLKRIQLPVEQAAAIEVDQAFGLLIDEMGYLNLRPEQTNIFFKLMEERYRRRATIITTNLEYDEWHNFLGNKPLVDALLSRLCHQCHTVRITGPSLRDPRDAATKRVPPNATARPAAVEQTEQTDTATLAGTAK